MVVAIIMATCLVGITPEEQQALDYINRAIASHGAGPVAYDARLTAAARYSANRWATNRGFDRHILDGEIQRFGFPIRSGPYDRYKRAFWSSNVSESGLNGLGWDLFRSVKHSVDFSLNEMLPQAPWEGHVRTLLGPWNCVGFAVSDDHQHLSMIFGSR